MADSIDIRVEGLAEVMKRLESLAGEGQVRAVTKAVKAAAMVEQAAVSAAAPVNATGGGILPEGALKNDFRITMKKGKDGNIYAVVGPGKYTKWVASMVEYGHRLVRGGRSYLNKKTGVVKGHGKVIGEVREHPFIRPTWEATKQEVVDVMTTTLNQEIGNELKKGGQ